MALTKIDDRGLKTPIDLLDNEKIRLGTGNDLELYHDGTQNLIEGTTPLYIKGSPVVLYKGGSTEKYFEGVADAEVKLYYDGSKKLETTSDGVTIGGDSGVSGNWDLEVYNGSGVAYGILAGTSGSWLELRDTGSSELLEIRAGGGGSSIRDKGTGDLNISGSIVRLQSSGEETLARGVENGAFELYYDNSKKFETYSSGSLITGNCKATGDFRIENDTGKIELGTSADLKLYHDGSDSWIRDSGTGRLLIDGSEINIRKYGAAETMAKFIQDGAVELYYDNAKKLETKSNGVSVSSSADTELEVKSTGQDGAPSILFVSDNGDNNDDNWRLRADGGGTAFSIQNYASGSWESNIVCKEDNTVELYYDNSKVFETNSAGATFGDSQVYTNRTSGSSKGFYIQAGGTQVGHFTNIGTGPEGILNLYNNGTHTVQLSGADGSLKLKHAGSFIQFGSTDASAHRLDDYEEGLVTATCSNSVTLHSSDDTFSYIKVGRLVTLMGQLRVNSDNSNATFTITNIPFTSADLTDSADHAAGACRIWSWDINVADHVGVMAFLGGGTTTLSFYVNRDGQSAESLPASAGGYIGFSITYMAAS